MIIVKSTAPNGAILITQHDSPTLAAIEMASRRRDAHINLTVFEMVPEKQDYTETATIHRSASSRSPSQSRGTVAKNQRFATIINKA